MSAKKKTAARPAVSVAAETPVQSAAERRVAESQLRSLIATFAPTRARLVAAARRWLLDQVPGAHEIVYEYRDCFVISVSPNENGYDGVFALRGSATGIELYFNQGKGLPDPAKLLRGSGKQTRSIALDGASILARPELAALVDAALARNPVPYARSGRGAVIVRSTTASKNRPATTKDPS
jgi:hypothetical protein